MLFRSLDASEPVKEAPTPTPKPATKAATVTVSTAPVKSEKMQDWEIKIKAVEESAWAPMVMDATRVALECVKSAEDVQSIFKTNRATFDRLKTEYNSMYDELLEEFKKTKESFKE